jgi:hypothetical protein
MWFNEINILVVAEMEIVIHVYNLKLNNPNFLITKAFTIFLAHFELTFYLEE